jgi:hypothetical protein
LNILLITDVAPICIGVNVHISLLLLGRKNLGVDLLILSLRWNSQSTVLADAAGLGLKFLSTPRPETALKQKQNVLCGMGYHTLFGWWGDVMLVVVPQQRTGQTSNPN